MTTNTPSTTTQGNAQSQPDRHSWPGCPGPAEMAAKYRSSGWRRDLEHVLKVYYRHTVQTPFREAEWARATERFFDHLTPRKAEAVTIKEETPLDYMPYIAEEFHRATGLCLNDLPEFTLWIKRGSYFHGLLVERGQVQQCPHLIGAPLPRWPQPKPSESREESYRRAEGPVVLVLGQPPLLHRRLPLRSPQHRRLLLLVPPTPIHLLRWRQVEREMARLGPKGLKQVLRPNSNRPGPQNALVPNQGDGRLGRDSPFPSWMRREDSPPLRGFTSMQGSSRPLGMMWLAEP